jgi:hypothetical protein
VLISRLDFKNSIYVFNVNKCINEKNEKIKTMTLKAESILSV